jgi:hypothetical protein
MGEINAFAGSTLTICLNPETSCPDGPFETPSFFVKLWFSRTSGKSLVESRNAGGTGVSATLAGPPPPSIRLKVATTRTRTSRRAPGTAGTLNVFAVSRELAHPLRRDERGSRTGTVQTTDRAPQTGELTTPSAIHKQPKSGKQNEQRCIHAEDQPPSTRAVELEACRSLVEASRRTSRQRCVRFVARVAGLPRSPHLDSPRLQCRLPTALRI